MERSPRSIYQRAATDGGWLGLWFVGIFAVSVGAIYAPMANILLLTMALMVPFICYRMLRRTYVASHALASFSALWMQGIISFVCGAIIFGLGAYIFLRWLYPGFMTDTIKAGIEYFRENPQVSNPDMADDLQKMIDQNLVPTPSTVVALWMWLCVFSGSVLSLFMAAIARIGKVPLSSGKA